VTDDFDGRRELDAPVVYVHGPDSELQPGVPVGRVESFEWAESVIYPGTTRTVRIHIPAQYSPGEPAALMVFQDGETYLDPNLDARAGIVFDNLIHAGQMPVTIGVFVDPGQPGNRNAEYDPANDRYVTFLLTEVLPAVRQLVTITDDPDLWAIGGGSSGGICAFTAAWQRPDRFRRVLSFVGSFAQIPGGNPYPALIRGTPPKPLRIFLQAARRDLNWDQPDLNWLSNNLLVAAALAERGYDHRLELGDGGHSTNHGGVLLPDALRWLWRPGLPGGTR
jgi:enterochelin esterase-like enzyme